MDFSLYVITDERFLNLETIEEKVEEAIEGGATVVQYRAKRKSSKQMYLEALKVRKVTKKHNIPFIVNDRLDIALSVKADGVHIGQDDLPVEAVREVAGTEFIIGLSTHNIDQVLDANGRDVNYIGFGPIFPTTTKENSEPPTGIALLCEAVRISKVPVVAIGGINSENVCDVLKCNPSGIAAVRAIFEANNPYNSARNLKDRIMSCRRERENSTDF